MTIAIGDDVIDVLVHGPNRYFDNHRADPIPGVRDVYPFGYCARISWTPWPSSSTARSTSTRARSGCGRCCRAQTCPTGSKPAPPPLQRAAGSPARARAAWAFIHGMIMLELNERFPDDGVTELAWQSGIAALQATAALR